MDVYLLFIGIGVCLIGYVIIVYLFFRYRIDKHDNISGFDIAKEITSDYDNINIILDKDSLMSKYFINRRVIKLSQRVYDGSDSFSLAVGSFLSGLSLNNSKYLLWLGKIFPTVGFLNKSSFVFAILSYFLYSKGDARIGIVVGLVILIYQYFYLHFFADSMNDVLDKMDYGVVKVILNWMYRCNMLFFIGSLFFMLRFVVILIK